MLTSYKYFLCWLYWYYLCNIDKKFMNNVLVPMVMKNFNFQLVKTIWLFYFIILCQASEKSFQYFLTGTVTYITGFNIIKNKVAIFIIQCTLKLYRKVKIIFCHTYFCKRNPMMRLYHILPYHVMLLLTKHASFGKY